MFGNSGVQTGLQVVQLELRFGAAYQVKHLTWWLASWASAVAAQVPNPHSIVAGRNGGRKLKCLFSAESALVGGPPWPGDGCDGRLGALDACLCKARLAVAEQTS